MSRISTKDAPVRCQAYDARRQTDSAWGSERYTGPLYKQVAEILRQKIFSVEWKPSKAIPNEQMLAVMLSVSVGTIRKALALLEDERLVRRTRGKGTFVIDACDDGELDRFCHLYVGSRPLRPHQSSISYSSGTATEEEAEKLGLEIGCPVYRIERLLIEPKCALAYEQIVVSSLLFPDLPSLIDGSYRFLFPLYALHFDIFVNQTIESARAIRLDPETASVLRLQTDPIALRIDRIAMAVGAGPVEWTSQSINLVDAVFKMTSA